MTAVPRLSTWRDRLRVGYPEQPPKLRLQLYAVWEGEAYHVPGTNINEIWDWYAPEAIWEEWS